MTLSKKSTDTRYIILLPVLPLHKLDTDIFQKNLLIRDMHLRKYLNIHDNIVAKILLLL